MQRDPRFPYDGYDLGGYVYDSNGGGSYYPNANPNSIPAYDNDPMLARSRPQYDFPGPLNQVEFQPSETCPKNYVIFDQTYNKSMVMFHPSLAHKFGSSSFDMYGGGNGYESYDHYHYRDCGNGKDTEECSVPHKEDTEEIDALLSSEEGEEDDVVSTGRTPGYWDGSSPDSSCSSKGIKSKSGCSPTMTQGGSSSNSERKKERMKKMVRTLKGIIPGGNQMDTPAVLDEAVRYLKSLKVEVKKLGVRNSEK